MTWPGHTREGRGRRWLAFHAANGTISIATNVVTTGPIMQMTGLPIHAANAIAVVAASFANFVAGDRVVFTGSGRSECVFTTSSWRTAGNRAARKSRTNYRGVVGAGPPP